MKPKIGTTIYVIEADIYFCIHKLDVGYLGKDAFVADDFVFKEYYDPIKYNDYNKKWFTSFDKAKNKLIKIFKSKAWDRIEDYELIQFSDRYWEVQ